MMANEMTEETTIGEARAFAQRAKMALYEAGRPDLGDDVAVVVRPEGDITLSTVARRYYHLDDPDAAVIERAVEIDPEFEPVI